MIFVNIRQTSTESRNKCHCTTDILTKGNSQT